MHRSVYRLIDQARKLSFVIPYEICRLPLPWLSGQWRFHDVAESLFRQFTIFARAYIG